MIKEVFAGQANLERDTSKSAIMIRQYHDDAIILKIFPHYWSFVTGIHRSHSGPVMQNFDISFVFGFNSRGACDVTPL